MRQAAKVNFKSGQAPSDPSFLPKKLRRRVRNHDSQSSSDSGIHTDEEEGLIALSEAEKLEVRNKKLYKMLEPNAVCVLPDPRIKLCNRLPLFSIL